MNPTDLQNLNNLATAYLEFGRLNETERVLGMILSQNDHHSAAINLIWPRKSSSFSGAFFGGRPHRNTLSLSHTWYLGMFGIVFELYSKDGFW